MSVSVFEGGKDLGYPSIGNDLHLVYPFDHRESNVHLKNSRSTLLLFILLCLLGVSTPSFAEVGVPTGNEFVPSSIFNANVAIFAERVASDIYNPNGTHDKWLKHNGFTTTNLIQYGSATTRAIALKT